jgi:quinol monooxygenase YgiN
MFESIARLKIRDDELEGFKSQVAEIVRQTREKETQPLRYDWFISDDGSECEVREAFVDADALASHQRSIGEAKAKLFHDFVAEHEMTFYGDPSPTLTGMLESMGTSYKRFSLFEGLDVREEVPA